MLSFWVSAFSCCSPQCGSSSSFAESRDKTPPWLPSWTSTTNCSTEWRSRRGKRRQRRWSGLWWRCSSFAIYWSWLTMLFIHWNYGTLPLWLKYRLFSWCWTQQWIPSHTLLIRENSRQNSSDCSVVTKIGMLGASRHREGGRGKFTNWGRSGTDYRQQFSFSGPKVQV